MAMSLLRLWARCAVMPLIAIAIHTAAAERPPNVVLMIADDLGYGSLGCYGQQHFATPQLDRLAAEGLRFTQAYAGSHVCQPSRCVLMTGQHTGHTAVRANDLAQMLLPEDVTLAEVLRERGLVTGAFGKWGLGFEDTTGHPRRQGFDEFFGQLLQVHAHFHYPAWVWHNEERFELTANHGRQQGRYVQDEVQARALEFIRHNHQQPFFAYLAYTSPHVELVVPEDSEQPFRGRFPQRAIRDPRRGYLSSDDGLATYAGMISRLDRHVGEVLELLSELQIADNTIVIFTSDNGGQSGGEDQGWTAMTDYFDANGGLRGYKGSFYEGGLRVPLIVRWPKHIQAGRTSAAVCGFQDLLPTLAQAVSAPPPENTDGVSLMDNWTQAGPADLDRFLYWEYPQQGGIARAARSGSFKIVQPRAGGPYQLYDLENDPAETHDLAGEQPQRVEQLVTAMDEAHRPPRSYRRPPFDPSIEDFVQ